MIDIHSHFIFGVDDGSRDLSSSLEMLEQANRDGVSDIICTPHFRKGVFETPAEVIKKHFDELKAANPYPINLYLGQEIAKHRGMFSRIASGELFTMNGTRYVLLEFKYAEDSEIEDTILDAKYSGYKPIIAHVERYEYVKEKDVKRFIEAGALIQVNADALVLKRGARYKRRVEKYLKHRLVHFVANDMHHSREYCMKKAYEYVSAKFGTDYADDLFINNAKVLLQ